MRIRVVVVDLVMTLTWLTGGVKKQRCVLGFPAIGERITTGLWFFGQDKAEGW